jgi:hypothetical protein
VRAAGCATLESGARVLRVRAAGWAVLRESELLLPRQGALLEGAAGGAVREVAAGRAALWAAGNEAAL